MRTLEARHEGSRPVRRVGLTRKGGSLAILIFAQIAILSLWFSSTAVLPEMAVESGVAADDLVWLSTAVPLGFAIGALIYAALGLADRYDPRGVFMLSALAGAMANLALLIVPIGGWEAIALRGITGATMAGVYPVGMKIAAGWGKSDRALLVSLLISGLTIGSASSHLMALSGGADWRLTIWASTLTAVIGGVVVLTAGLGPWHASAPTLDITAISLIWTNRPVRLAVLGYIGHMWELYAFWAWVGVVASASYSLDGSEIPRVLGKLTAFLAIGLGGLACVPAGWLAVHFGSARVAQLCLCGSGAAALASAVLFGGPAWEMMAALILWGIAIIPDSALYSTLVADAAPPERTGSLLTIQTALGFFLTALTVQATPTLAEFVGWSWVLAIMALGPALGIRAMQLLIWSCHSQRTDPAG
ncbi:MAG TPA: MFS transporter [Casimicrobiaceae bacterium]|nr:MFS transporter [Casimicrobiaceae bacterium]